MWSVPVRSQLKPAEEKEKANTVKPVTQKQLLATWAQPSDLQLSCTPQTIS